MNSFIDRLSHFYTLNASPENAVAMAKYMKNLFPFHGIKTDLRRKLHKEATDDHKREVQEYPRSIAVELYKRCEREYHYSAVEILIKELRKKFVIDDIGIIEYLLVTHSWWDSVDTISKYLLGEYLRQFP